jgi:hypothetical protein
VEWTLILNIDIGIMHLSNETRGLGEAAWRRFNSQ